MLCKLVPPNLACAPFKSLLSKLLTLPWRRWWVQGLWCDLNALREQFRRSSRNRRRRSSELGLLRLRCGEARNHGWRHWRRILSKRRCTVVRRISSNTTMQRCLDKSMTARSAVSRQIGQFSDQTGHSSNCKRNWRFWNQTEHHIKSKQAFSSANRRSKTDRIMFIQGEFKSFVDLKKSRAPIRPKHTLFEVLWNINF